MENILLGIKILALFLVVSGLYIVIDDIKERNKKE